MNNVRVLLAGGLSEPLKESINVRDLPVGLNPAAIFLS